MKKIKPGKVAEFSSIALALLTILLVVTVSSASAKESKGKKSSTGGQVVAHISFSGLSAVDMTLQRQSEEKRYLYVQHGREEGVSIIDITDPANAKVVRTIPWPNPHVSNRMNVLGDVAIIRETDGLSVGPTGSKDDVVLWDLTNPAAPKEVQKFSGVVKVLEDGHNFIYLLNSEGLWVISEPERHPQQGGADAYGG
jgi:hypothetical protein